LGLSLLMSPERKGSSFHAFAASRVLGAITLGPTKGFHSDSESGNSDSEGKPIYCPGKIVTRFLSRPTLSNFTTPSILANKV